MSQKVKLTLFSSCDVLQHIIRIGVSGSSMKALDHSFYGLQKKKKTTSTGAGSLVDEQLSDGDESSSDETCNVSELKERSVSNHAKSYFDSRSSTTSDHSLSRICGKVDYEQIMTELSRYQYDHARLLSTLKDDYECLFQKWMYQLCQGTNLLFHGVGSKRHVLDKFLATKLKDFTQIVVNGYFPGVTCKSILNAITENVVERKEGFHSLQDQCDFIQRTFQAGSQPDVILVLYSIDGCPLQSRKMQSILSMVARVRNIHLIATIDHVNVSLLWNNLTLSGFAWSHYDLTTYDVYDNETSFENSMLLQQTAFIQLSSLLHVLNSLTTNAQRIFCIMAEYQVRNSVSSTYTGLSFPDLYQKCREAFLVSSDLTLRAQLTEFHDHKLIRVKKGVDGVEYITVSLDSSLLTEFLSQHADS